MIAFLFLLPLSLLDTTNAFSLKAPYHNIFHASNKNHRDYRNPTILLSSSTEEGYKSDIVSNERRHVLLRAFTTTSSLLLLSSNNNVVHAEEELSSNNNKIFITGKVLLKSDIVLPSDTTTSALYVTARPNKADNVPKAILDGSNGKPPPIFAVRIPNPTFPVTFQFTTSDITPEGRGSDNNNSNYWFESNTDLILSARWDTDGIAATRDPTDLVGRTIVSSKNINNSNDDTISVLLTGRGFTGKLVTNKASK
mmetsp:Transcript_32192/g.35666  ORF Transcript_32192/g.35666 Transcript_32192/m.35666 type:complete len:253 (+) Transcript_32192:27-785(+)